MEFLDTAVVYYSDPENAVQIVEEHRDATPLWITPNKSLWKPVCNAKTMIVTYRQFKNVVNCRNAYGRYFLRSLTPPCNVVLVVDGEYHKELVDKEVVNFSHAYMSLTTKDSTTKVQTICLKSLPEWVSVMQMYTEQLRTWRKAMTRKMYDRKMYDRKMYTVKRTPKIDELISRYNAHVETAPPVFSRCGKIPQEKTFGF